MPRSRRSALRSDRRARRSQPIARDRNCRARRRARSRRRAGSAHKAPAMRPQQRLRRAHAAARWHAGCGCAAPTAAAPPTRPVESSIAIGSASGRGDSLSSVNRASTGVTGPLRLSIACWSARWVARFGRRTGARRSPTRPAGFPPMPDGASAQPVSTIGNAPAFSSASRSSVAGFSATTTIGPNSCHDECAGCSGPKPSQC